VNGEIIAVFLHRLQKVLWALEQGPLVSVREEIVRENYRLLKEIHGIIVNVKLEHKSPANNDSA